ncbi:winged helix-turn-helix domain-containing protein [Haloarchaeobius amylolyticus]|uniref:winged helix-turn-helix domain-containing protein n=1 Tax=Haloarchaeobius amylolyticus TaxID=1198296 RepID=UPI00227217FA|nr:helix-turn-helix domain-containing protein [Haloarchaeobius amylolyticus]
MDDDAATRAPEEAFGLVANETRLAILRALWEADDQVLSFSELRDAVGVRDTGQFNYHLGKLVGTFVDRVEPGEDGGSNAGYELRFAGLTLLGAVLSGVYTRETEVGPVPIDLECLECGGPLSARYEHGEACIDCDDCGEQFMGYGVPSGVVEGRDPDRLPEIFTSYLYTVMTQVSTGFCPVCTGRIWGSVFEKEDRGYYARYTCDRCGLELTSFLGGAVLTHPVVVGFLADHGIDIRTEPFWQFDWFDAENATVTTEDPLRVDVTFAIDDERLILTLDESLAVVETHRET